jgi:serpin B
MADVSLLNRVEYPGQSPVLKMTDAVLFFARTALGYEDITYKQLENSQTAQDRFQMEQATKVKNCFVRILCAIVALVLILPTVAALAVKACMKGRQDADVAKIHAQGVTKLLPMKPSNSSTSSTTHLKPIAVSSEHQKQARVAITNFANDLCARISNEQGSKSYSVSPVSIIAALGMCLHAIRPDKKALFLEKIGLKGLSEQEAHGAIAMTLREMAIPQGFKNGTINIAQGMAYKDKNVVADSFVKLVKEIYGADVIVSENIMGEVNKWVSDKTNKKIPTLLSDNDADLVLLNAIYLNLQWQDKFEKRGSWPVEPFTAMDGSQAPVSMMKQKGDYLIYRGTKFSMLEKPYLSPDGRKLSQVIFLPSDPADLPELESGLTAEFVQKCRKEARMEHDVNLSMPKTKAESEFHMLDLLKNLGLPLDSLDPNIVRGLGFTDVIHKTFVSTNEEGTEAAAATGMVAKCCISEPRFFNIKHAYIYLIMDGDTVIFRGKVSDKKPLVVD